MLAPDLKLRCWRVRLSLFSFALLGGLLCSGPSAFASVITNVTVVNVTPTSFGVLWRAGDSTPSIAVFADAAGSSSLAGQLGVEAFPLHTGNPALAAGYFRRLGRAALRQKTRSDGLMLVQVTDCHPRTTYYFQAISTPAGGSPAVYPASGPLPSVTTASENTFVVSAQQLVIDVPGLDMAGRIVTLTHTNAAHPLAAVIGDGCGTNQVFFNLNDLFALTGGNFSPTGSEEFNVNVLGPNQAEVSQTFTVNFVGAFGVAQNTMLSFGTEFVALSVGSTVMLAGQTNSVVIGFNSSVGLTDLTFSLQMNTERLTNLTLHGLSTELDSGAASVTRVTGSNWLVHLPARTGQSMLGGHELAQLRFTAIPNLPSAFVNLTVTGLEPRKSDNSLVADAIAQSGRVVVIEREPLLETGLDRDGTRHITMYGKPGSSYALQYSTNLNNAAGWTSMNRIPMTGMTASFDGMHGNLGTYFYRAMEFFADPPLADAIRGPAGSRQVLVYGVPSSQYSLTYATNLSGVVTWYPVLNYTLTNSFQYLTVPSTNRTIFYRPRRN